MEASLARSHPLIVGAALAIILLCLAGAAAISGLLPVAVSQSGRRRPGVRELRHRRRPPADEPVHRLAHHRAHGRRLPPHAVAARAARLRSRRRGPHRRRARARAACGQALAPVPLQKLNNNTGGRHESPIGYVAGMAVGLRCAAAGAGERQGVRRARPPVKKRARRPGEGSATGPREEPLGSGRAPPYAEVVPAGQFAA
jgi:hypothetical protein